ncbi:Polyketide cyclase / dehydrase and lipid transport [Micromonospora viridifaciens]|uniref:Polyketide cyclase / dehydrase and lipid transport n=1 Tax=Micromonospora viridifaciens TaxID=1881 RepID=A0A1C4Y9U7_MICVI|nr:SRPBCC family protein [Micromonospora viridifaciens]SCF17513.1 Polyketide cyclase / dehydrase and lipid transport [Micromonospora viridifaciens]
MEFEETVSTTASIDRCWAALEDVTAYPRWTASMSAVAPLDGPELRPGHRFRIRQPGLPTTVWRVREVTAGTSFAWDAHAPGVHTVAHHRVDPQADGTIRIRIRIGIRQTGAVAWLVAALTATRTRRYLRMEAAGLKAAAEAAGAADDSAAAGDDTASTGGR